MDDRNTMTQLLAGEALTPTEAAVFGAEFVRAREFYRHHVADVLEVGERSFTDACEAVEALEVTLAEARASAPVAPVAEPVAVTFEPGPIRPEPPDHELVRENEVLRSNSDHLSSENASLARQVESMAMRIESLAEELAKPEDVRLREVLDEMDEWIGRAGEAERLAEERLAHANQLQADIEAEMQGRLALRKRLGAREDETMGAFLERLAAMAGVVPADVHEHGWQWRPTATDTAFAPPFGTIRQCRCCGCLVAGGPTACVRCAKAGE